MIFAAWMDDWRRQRSERRRQRRIAARLKGFSEMGNTIEITPQDLSRVYVEIVGTGNSVRIGALGDRSGLLTVRVFANDSTVEIAPGLSINHDLEIVVGGVHPKLGPVTDCAVRIGKDLRVESARFAVYTSHSEIRVGDDCLIAYDVNLYNSDAHPIYDLKTDQMINHVGTLSVGNHVWLGAKVTVLKNVSIPDGCIVGFGSVVAGRFTEPNRAIAGNPARVVGGPNRLVRWENEDPRYIANEIPRG